jgi:2,3-bisphosphoglycerate-dependent phosphoglycerate mutase
MRAMFGPIGSRPDRHFWTCFVDGTEHSSLVLVRHGESQSNADGRFAGWRDVPLTERGRQQAQRCGQLLLAGGWSFDVAYTSMLRRAAETAELALAQLRPLLGECLVSWRLNERHTGQLQGLTKQEAKARFGRELARQYRRSWDQGPPAVESGSVDDPAVDPRYSDLGVELPRSEAMGDVARRIQPFVEEELLPRLRQGQHVILFGHGMALRALARPFEGIVAAALPAWKLASAAPRCYRFDSQLQVLTVEELLGSTDAPDE